MTTVVTQGSTKRVLRQAVGRNLVAAGGLALDVIEAAANGSTTTFLVDLISEGSANQHKGKFWLGTDSPNDGVSARVTASSVSSNRTTLTLFPAVTSTLDNDTAELWEGYNPKDIDNYMDQAIMEITGKAYDPEESLALHADGRETVFSIPAQFAMLNQIDYRWSVESIIIDNATDVWTEQGAVSGVTNEQDTKDFKQGPASLRINVGASVSTDIILASKKIDPKDISGMDFSEFWVKSSVALAAGDYQLLLDDTAACASPIETQDIPALTADTWTYIRVALANPQDDTAIISVGVKQVVDKGAMTFWINRVQSVLENTSRYATLHKDRWSVEGQKRELVFKPSGRTAVGYALLKLIGGDKPTLFTAETTVNEVSDWYVIAMATFLALSGPSGGQNVDPDNRRAAADRWWVRSQQAKFAHHLPQNTRII